MLRNYTTETPANTSIGRIMGRLVDHGCKAIQQEYEDKKLVALSFIIVLPDGSDLPIKLPARVKQIEVVLRQQVRKPTDRTHERIAEQAQRTAWKLLDEWITIQLDLVKLQQIEFLELFLPYVYRPQLGKTYYESLREDGFRALALPPRGGAR